MAKESGQNPVSVQARASESGFRSAGAITLMRSMEACERQLPFDREDQGGARASRQVRLIDPVAIDYGSGGGLARLELMVTTVFDRLTAVNVPSGSDA